MIQVSIAGYITSLLSFDETKVLIGRDNATIEVFSDDYIVIDVLNEDNLADGKVYDYDIEEMTHNVVMSGTYTIEFYGSNGRNNVFKFLNMLTSQKGSDLQKQYGVTMYRPKGVNDLKQVVGNRYFDRFEVEIVITYNQSLIVDTLRIESIPVSYIED